VNWIWKDYKNVREKGKRQGKGEGKEEEEKEKERRETGTNEQTGKQTQHLHLREKARERREKEREKVMRGKRGRKMGTKEDIGGVIHILFMRLSEEMRETLKFAQT
jgi:hypothetical protein